MVSYNYDIPAVNGTGVDEVVADIAQTIPIFTPLFLLSIFLTVFITGYNKQKISSGFGDAPQWATIAGVSTMSVALLMTLREGLINLPTLIITVIVTIFCGIWLFSSNDRI